MSKEVIIGCGYMAAGATILLVVEFHYFGWWGIATTLGLYIAGAGLLYVREHG